MSTTPPGTVTLEQAWKYLMSQYALLNPVLLGEAHLARKALQNLMTARGRRH